MSESDTALAERARTGDRAAFEELVRRTARLVYARLYLETGDPHRTEDLLQETLLQAFRSIHRLDNPAGFRSWLLTIAHNTLTDAARRDARLKRTPTPLVVSRSPAATPMEQASNDESRQQVLAVLRSLPEEYRLPLTLRFIAGADYETIGTQLGLTNGSLRGLFHRGLKMLRDRLPREEFG
jgi:RNA polymerase sigma-70 factor (ECF subfamily)